MQDYRSEEYKAKRRLYLERPGVKERVKELNRLRGLKYRASAHGRAAAKERSRLYAQTLQAKQALKAYREANKNKIKAQNLANTWIKQTHVCSVKGCSKIAEKHHPDYRKPFDIVWLCRLHHRAVHGKVRGFCSICASPHYAKGLCQKHYRQQKRKGEHGKSSNT
jgi:hypothetical protein